MDLTGGSEIPAACRSTPSEPAVLITSGALAVALLHNTGTLGVMANAGRLLRFQDKAPEFNRMCV